MDTWRKAKEFVCPVCQKDFDKERQLKQHHKDSHAQNEFVFVKTVVFESMDKSNKVMLNGESK